MTALFVVALGGLRVDGRAPFSLSDGGVWLRSLEGHELPFTDEGHGQVRDLVLESESAAVIVGASRATPEREAEYGRIVGATASTWEADALEALAVVARGEGGAIRLATRSVDVAWAGDHPAIRIEQRSGALSVVTTVAVRVARSFVELTTQVTNVSGSRLTGVQVGDEVHWPGVNTFVPGLGEVVAPARLRVDWFGRQSPGQAYAWFSPEGPMDAEFHTGHEPYQIAWCRPHDLAPREQFAFRRRLVLDYQGLARAAEASWTALGTAVGRVVGKLEPPPARASLSAISVDGSWTLTTRVAPDGAFDFVLPEGVYSLRLRAPGGVVETLVDVSGAAAAHPKLVVPESGWLKFDVTDALGGAMPARLRVSGTNGTPDPVFGPDYRAQGAGAEVHSATGFGEVELPPGDYRVTVTRGPEYSVNTRPIHVTPERGAVVSAVLGHEVETPGWIAADFHVHSAPSMDSEVRLEDRIATLLAAGVEFAVATDHNHVTDFGPVIASLGVTTGIDSTVGVEVTTKEWGHFNVFPMPSGAPAPPYAEIDPAELFPMFRQSRLAPVIQVNHPWMPGYGYFFLSSLDEATLTPRKQGYSPDFDALEVINGFELKEPGSLNRNLERWFKLLNAGARYTAVGNSDSHRVVNEWVGYPRTYVAVEDDRPGRVTAAEIARALRSGRAMVSAGPVVFVDVEGVEPGATLEMLPGEVNVHVVVRAAERIPLAQVDLFVNGELVDVLPISAPPQRDLRLDRVVPVRIDESGWIVVVVRGSRPLEALLPGLPMLPFAFSNPIYFAVHSPRRPTVPFRPPTPVADAAVYSDAGSPAAHVEAGLGARDR